MARNKSPGAVGYLFMRAIALSILVITAALSCEPGDQDSAVPGNPTLPQIAVIASNYKHLRSMTKEPVLVDSGLAMLCRGATQREVEEARKTSGPHAHTAVSIYMNDLAANAFRLRSGTYPLGSVIVKEKKALGYRPEADERAMVNARVGVGGMIKRPRGFDAAHGDWEYFYFEDVSRIERGKITSCVQCHGGASTRDYVFGGWAGTNRLRNP